MQRTLCSNRCNEHEYNQKDHNKNILMVITSIMTMSIMIKSIMIKSIMVMSTVEVIIK